MPKYITFKMLLVHKVEFELLHSLKIDKTGWKFQVSRNIIKQRSQLATPELIPIFLTVFPPLDSELERLITVLPVSAGRPGNMGEGGG